MARTAKPANNSTIPVQDVVGPLIDDYVSQTDVTNQAVASNLNFASGKTILFNSVPFMFAPKFTITKSGSNYHVLKEDGTLSYSTSSLETAVVDEAFAGLTGGFPETVLVKGDMVLDGTVKVPSFCDLALSGRITAVDGLNSNMFENADRTNGNTFLSIRGVGQAIIDGNASDQASGGIIDIDTNDVDQTPYGEVVWLKDLFLMNAKETSVKVITNTANSCNLDGINIKAGGGVGLNLVTSDSQVSNCRVNSYGENLYLGQNAYSLGNWKFNNCYFGGTGGGGITSSANVVINGVHHALFNNCTFDNSYHEMIRLIDAGGQWYQRCYDVMFNTCEITDAYQWGYPDVDDTFAAVSLEDNTNNCSFNNTKIGIKGRGDAPTTSWKYGVQEVGSADYNSVLGCNFAGTFGTADYVLLGGNSFVRHCIGASDS
jgi:hypothetical protein